MEPRPLPAKLGVRPGCRVSVLDAPPGFALDLAGALPAVRGEADVILLFCPQSAALHRLPALVRRLSTAGGLWVAYPKKSSGVVTDIDFGAVQRAGLATGLVDNKICAIDETWTAMRFVRRLRDR